MDIAERAWIVDQFSLGVPQTAMARYFGCSTSKISVLIKTFCDEWANGIDVEKERIYGEERRGIARYAALRFRVAGNTLRQPTADFPNSLDKLNLARKEHAWLLRAEGFTFKEIGRRLGVSREQARVLVAQFGRRAARAMRRVSFSLCEAA